MRRITLTEGRLVVVPDSLTHAEFVRQGGPDRLRLRDHGDVMQVHVDDGDLDDTNQPPSS